MRARPRVSSGPMPPEKTGKSSERMMRVSRTSPSVTQPAAPRARAAVVSSSPQRRHAVRRSAAGEHRDVAGREVVEQPDLELVGVLVVEDGIGIRIEPGPRPAMEDQRFVERAHEGTTRLVGVAHLVHHVGKDRRVQRTHHFA
jgi:hypothetical protein